MRNVIVVDVQEQSRRLSSSFSFFSVNSWICLIFMELKKSRNSYRSYKPLTYFLILSHSPVHTLQGIGLGSHKSVRKHGFCTSQLAVILGEVKHRCNGYHPSWQGTVELVGSISLPSKSCPRHCAGWHLRLQYKRRLGHPNKGLHSRNTLSAELLWNAVSCYMDHFQHQTKNDLNSYSPIRVVAVVAAKRKLSNYWTTPSNNRNYVLYVKQWTELGWSIPGSMVV